ncbi:porin [Nevskia sp.]|uniref:porin n=1 Tax=Nevskia sp. TaxID=1929292 RepID=UPI0025EB57B2|nr:porin [Nevskia sp.]
MKSNQRKLIAAAVAMLSSTGASALELNAGDYKFTVNGNINVHYIYSSCENNAVAVGGGLACTETGSAGNNSSISNGLLPAALTFGIITQQAGLDIEGHFGFYPGVSSNDGGSPNLQQGAPLGTNVALATTALDVRQVYLTFGNKDIGTFSLGRNFGLFGFDAIINDITIPGVGAAGAAAVGAPANTTLGSIGLGYIYVDTLAQINYTTPDFAGFKATVGIYDPLNPVGAAASQHSAPGFHGKLQYTTNFSGAKLYLSATGLTQKQNDVGGPGNNYTSSAFDFGGKLTIADFELAGWYYVGDGVGTTALFLNSDDGAGNKRESDGFLAQATYKLGATKLGVNYGVSSLDLAGGEVNPTLVKDNKKITGGIYHSLTKNLTLVGEVTAVEAKNHSGGKNEAINFNIGTFLSF